MRRSVLLLIILAAGCRSSSPDFPSGVPQFAVVDPANNICRSGQPNNEGWKFLRQEQGITNVVKLNEEEDHDILAIAHDFTVVDIPITFKEQLIGGDNLSAKIDRAVRAISSNTIVHCLHGQDRTGLAIAVYRVRVQHWTKARAQAEMLDRGFHKELHGLWEYWERFEK